MKMTLERTILCLNLVIIAIQTFIIFIFDHSYLMMGLIILSLFTQAIAVLSSARQDNKEEQVSDRSVNLFMLILDWLCVMIQAFTIAMHIDKKQFILWL